MTDLKKELRRKTFHMLILVVVLLYYLLWRLFSQKIALFILVLFLLILLFSEFLRLDLGFKVHFFHRMLREKEEGKLHGAVYFLLSTIICLVVFDFPIAFAALLMATFGDLAAAIIGKGYGKRKIYKSKTVAGSLAGFLVNILAGFLVLRSSFIVVFMALGATIVEVLSDKIDDNLTVPILAGALGQLLVFLF